MSIFNNLFGNKGKTESKEAATVVAEQPSTVLDTQPEIAPPVDLFIDNNAPQPEQDVEQTESKLTVFLNRNYHSIGINDGFEYHSQETLETAKKKIRAEFQLVIDQAIEVKSARKFQARTMLISVANISSEAKQNLELLIEELCSSISKLEKQKELSIENEGWLMNALHSYQQGFIQGVNQWTMTEQLLYSPQIFNSKN